MSKYPNYNSQKWYPKRILIFSFFVLLIVAMASAVVLLLWNMILAKVVDVRPISFWEAVGIFVLFRLLLGGFFYRFRGKERHWHNKKAAMREKWMNMSAEERHEFKNRWKEYCKRKED